MGPKTPPPAVSGNIENAHNSQANDAKIARSNTKRVSDCGRVDPMKCHFFTGIIGADGKIMRPFCPHFPRKRELHVDSILENPRVI